MRRQYGSVESKNGRFRARHRVNGKLETIGTFTTEDEADAALVLFASKFQATSPFCGETLASWSRKFLDERENDEVHRDVQNDRHLFKRASGAPFAELPLAAITTRDIRDWVKDQIKTPSKRTGKKPGRQTVVNALNLLRVCLEAACEAGLIDQNPARGVKVPRIARTTERWTWLQREEIAKLLGDATDAEHRDIFTVAIYTGLRAGEIFGLEWSDVDLRHSTASVRHSWRGRPTKAGVARTVNLFENVVAALTRQRKRTGSKTHVFPDRGGLARSKDQMPDLSAFLAAVGITRPVRFHDLRHTCASHLVQGTWGRTWSIEEVKGHLGHTSITTTQRYAHLCPSGIKRAANETRPDVSERAIPAVPRLFPNVPQASEDDFAKYLVLAEEKGFEPLVRLPPRRFSKPGVNEAITRTSPGTGNSWGTKAASLLDQLKAGTCTAGDVARMAADVLANPPPLQAAAKRYLESVGGKHEGPAAVDFLALLVSTGSQAPHRSEAPAPRPQGQLRTTPSPTRRRRRQA